MITSAPRCGMCARPIVPGTTGHVDCQEWSRSLNDWPDGSRQLPCLRCGRSFRSDSKVQRLCPPCRTGGRPAVG